MEMKKKLLLIMGKKLFLIFESKLKFFIILILLNLHKLPDGGHEKTARDS